MDKSLKTKIALFEGKQIRRLWDPKKEVWYFSVVDTVQVLTSQSDFTKARKYWNKLAERLRSEGSEVVTDCHQLKMIAADGKFRRTDAADTQTMLRIIQSIPSPNAEPFKLWLAKVGYERIEEADDPELAINRALKNYLRKGYSREWINQRLKAIEIRKELTDEWADSGVKEGFEFAMLTDELTKAWSGMKTRKYKQFKGLKKENLRDNMTNIELALNILAEVSTTEISKTKRPQGYKESKVVAKEGGGVAGGARKNLEEKLGHSVISKSNFLDLKKQKNLQA